jgi:hypothetical protein
VILFLEHLMGPVEVLERLTRDLQPNGTVVVSVPDVAHVEVVAPLFFLRGLENRDVGFLDRTDLRLFARASAVKTMNSASLTVKGGPGRIFGSTGEMSRSLDFRPGARSLDKSIHHLGFTRAPAGVTRADLVEDRLRTRLLALRRSRLSLFSPAPPGCFNQAPISRGRPTFLLIRAGLNAAVSKIC